MGWVLLIVVLVLILVALLWVPIILTIDTLTNTYELRLKGLAWARVEPDEETLIRIRIRIGFYQFDIDPIDKWVNRRKRKRITAHTPKPKKREKKPSRFNFQLLWRLLKTFQVKRFLWKLDTGDCVLNARLYPAFALMDYYVGGFQINFEGSNRLLLEVHNRPIHIITSFINLKK